LDDQLDLRDFHRVPVTILDLVLEIAKPVTMSPGRGRVVVVEGLLQSVSMV